MNYATEWQPLPLDRRNALCAEAMGCCGTRLRATWSPCTDRNHTAMMVDEVAIRCAYCLCGSCSLGRVHGPYGLACGYVADKGGIVSEIMLEAVLQMPYGMAMADELSRRQYWERGQQALAELAALRAENVRLRDILIHARGLAGIIAADGNWAGNTWRGELRPSSTALDLCDEIILALSVSKDAEQDTGCQVSPRGAWISLEQLREIEWNADEDGWPACPACGGLQGCAHKPDCLLARAIKQAEEKA